MHTAPSYRHEFDLVLLVTRLFIGLRLLGGASRKIIGWNSSTTLVDTLYGKDLPVPEVLALLFTVIQLLAGISLILGIYTRWLAWLSLGCCLFLLMVFAGDELFTRGMPPLASFVLCSVFIIIPPGRYTWKYLRRKGWREE